MIRRSISIALLASCASAAAPAFAELSAEELAKIAQNPVGNLISIPFQNNTNLNYGSEKGTQNILNIQPVIPFEVSKDWNIITRTIVPIIWLPALGPDQGAVSGLGDMQFSAFLSPVLLVAKGDPWVYGVLVNNIWSFGGGNGSPSYNNGLIQPFLNYNFEGGTYLTSSPILTVDWKAEGSQRWIVPIGGGIGHIFHFGRLPVNTQVAAYYNIAKPDFGPNWQIRAQVQLMFPK
jgi:hypothetical protein